MTPEIRKTLLGLLNEYDLCLTRAQGNKDLMKCIEDRAVTECGITVVAFKTVATAIWRDQADKVKKDLDAKSELLACVRNEEKTTE